MFQSQDYFPKNFLKYFAVTFLFLKFILLGKVSKIEQFLKIHCFMDYNIIPNVSMKQYYVHTYNAKVPKTLSWFNEKSSENVTLISYIGINFVGR